MPAPHEQRVIDERQEMQDNQATLDTRRQALAAFIDSNPIFGKLPAAEQERMKRQLGIMEQCSQGLGELVEVLGERIAAFTG